MVRPAMSNCAPNAVSSPLPASIQSSPAPLSSVSLPSPPQMKSPESRSGVKRAPEIRLPEELKGLTLNAAEKKDLGDVRVELIDD